MNKENCALNVVDKIIYTMIHGRKKTSNYIFELKRQTLLKSASLTDWQYRTKISDHFDNHHYIPYRQKFHIISVFNWCL